MSQLAYYAQCLEQALMALAHCRLALDDSPSMSAAAAEFQALAYARLGQCTVILEAALPDRLAVALHEEVG
jgi:hypothetical protein